jgi:hypothetical protein
MSAQKTAAGFVIAVAASSIASTASAQQSRLPTTDWRQADRGEAVTKKVTSPQSLAFELRFGPYSPQIDDEPGLTGTPYKDVFWPTGYSPQFYFGMELDYLPLRIPYVGAIGPGVGWGFTTTSEKANYSDGAQKGQPSTADTSLTIMPMHVSAVLRADELMRRTGVPIVPYGKAGFGMGYWSASTSNGTEVYTKPDGEKVSGTGLSYGFQFALGGMLSLNFIDPRAAARLDETTGVNHAYLFGEWMNNSMVGRNSSSMYVGTSTWVLGLAIDM